MFLRYLTWIFAGLFVLFGLPMLITDSTAWSTLWAGLSTLCLGGWALSMVRDAIKTGEIRIRSAIRHANQPRLFWATVGLVATAGAGVLVATFAVLVGS